MIKLKKIMSNDNKAVELEYYIKEGISPVHYQLDDLKKHFDIRNSLYFLLGLPSFFLENKDVLEVAPGSGHNSLFTSSLKPRTYDLVEPNPLGCEDIKKNFQNLNFEHTKPRLFEKKIEEHISKKKYDLVITEGWPGGFLDYDKEMLRKISSFVKKGGLLFISFFPPCGALSTYLRRLISNKILNKDLSNKEKTKYLKNIFSSHLQTMGSMTRSKEHWIQDSLLNPYICLAHNTPVWCKEILNNDFIFYQSVPKFSKEWRWYKSLHGSDKKFNDKFISEYLKILHCLVDFRVDGFNREEEKNLELEKLCCEIANLTKKYENLVNEKYKEFLDPVLEKIIINLDDKEMKKTQLALKQARALLLKNNIEKEDIDNMSEFKFLFGREQCYLSFIKS